MYCGNCGTQLAQEAAACSSCGVPTAEPKAMAAAATMSPTAAFPQTTKACPFCGEQILPEAVRCKHCQASLAPAPLNTAGVSVQGPQLQGGAQPTIVIQNVQTQQGPQAPTFVPGRYKNPGLALFLSFIFPGGGQFYNGHAGKGILVLLTFWMFGITWIWSLFDAYNSANRINRVGY